MNKLIKAAIIRAIRTFAQTALGMITVGATLSEIDWMTILSVSVVATIYSILTSIVTGLPEAKSDPVTTSAGDLYVYTDHGEPQFLVDLNQIPDEIAKSDRAIFDVRVVEPKQSNREK